MEDFGGEKLRKVFLVQPDTDAESRAESDETVVSPEKRLAFHALVCSMPTEDFIQLIQNRVRDSYKTGESIPEA